MYQFDFVKCELPIPDCRNGIPTFRTTDVPGSSLRVLRLTRDGRLVQEESFNQDTDLNWDRDLRIYSPLTGEQFVARFVDGTLRDIVSEHRLAAGEYLTERGSTIVVTSDGNISEQSLDLNLGEECCADCIPNPTPESCSGDDYYITWSCGSRSKLTRLEPVV